MPRSIARALAAVVVLVAIGCQGTAPTASPTANPTASPTPSPTVAPTPSPTPESIDDVLRLTIMQRARDTIATGTVSVALDASVDGNVTMPDGAVFGGTGAVSFEQPTQMVLEADFTALGLGAITMIVDDTLLYMTGDFLEVLELEADQWLLVDLTSDDPRVVPFLSVTTGQNDSSLVLYYLFGTTGHIERLATESINGVSTTHFGMKIDLDAAAQLAPEAARENLLDNIAGLRSSGIERTVAGEVWIDLSGMVRQVRYVYTVGRTGGGGTMTVRYTFDDFGDPLDLGIPAAKDVVKLEDLPG